MPCYLFTYHGHGTWMPDHPKGFVHRTRGLQPRDVHMAKRYRENQRDDAVKFSNAAQMLMMETARNAGSYINAVVHGCATESTHIHVLISWKHDREWKSMRMSVRRAITRALNDQNRKCDWFSDSPSRKRVATHEHFDYLMLEYLPGHSRSGIREEDRENAESRDRLRETSVRLRRKRKRSKK